MFTMLTRMDDENEEFLEDMTDDLIDLVGDKFRKGQAEHGGNIWDLPVLKLIDSAMEEAIDQFVYLYTLRQQLLKPQNDKIDE